MKLFEEIITSRNNPQVKWAASLQDKKGRDAAATFIAEGEKLTFEALDCGLPVSHIFIDEERFAGLWERLGAYASAPQYRDTVIYRLSSTAFSKISTEKAPQGIISAIKYLDFFREVDIIYKEDFCLLPAERAIILCSVRDPGNLGAIIRSSVAFGVDNIIISSDTVDVYNPKTVRSAMGSLFRVKITRVKSLENFIGAARSVGRAVYAAELSQSAKPLGELKLSRTDLVMIGNEGHGIAADISAACTGSVYIPISKKTESLNAAVAAALFMWEQSK